MHRRGVLGPVRRDRRAGADRSCAVERGSRILEQRHVLVLLLVFLVERRRLLERHDEQRGPSKDAGSPPPAPACASESEPNDSLQAADTFKSCITGGLKGRDVDFVSTVAPATTKQVAIAHGESGGKVSYRVFVNGVPYPSFTEDPPSSLPATPNATYTFQIQPTGQSTGDRSWKLEVTFQ